MRIKLFALFTIVSFFFAVFSSVAVARTLDNKNKQDELTLTLKEAIFLALRNNAKVKSAEVGRVSQKYAIVVAKHSFRPHYFLEGNYQYYSTTVNTNKYSKDAFDVKPKVSLLTPFGTELALSMNNPITKDRDNVSALLTTYCALN